ncbi:MAG TPA: hypothetical protein VFV67_27640 [Actinophytocola sp.]|uniref:hypothetical protein n=1 Tax=Actinophytocola sp. TaxID=1872138 RepID=UPI002DB687F7|nr:hypothetical protein [Actinophytocola sp.]HEU5474438.1 hypothetical protein [Actinophytocola sp.]
MMVLFAHGRKEQAFGFIIAPVLLVAIIGVFTGGFSGVLLAVRLETPGARIATGVIGGLLLAFAVLLVVAFAVQASRPLPVSERAGRTAWVAIEDRLIELWKRPPDEHADPLRAFAELYADPVFINGVATPLTEVVERARALHVAFSDHVFQLLDRVVQSSSGLLAISFRHTARHVGPWRTALGEVPATGRTVTGLGIDILTIVGDRVHKILVVADELQRLVQVAEPSGPLRPLLGGPVR